MNQRNVVVKMKDVIDDMETLDFSKNKLEKVRKYYIENEMKIHAVVSNKKTSYICYIQKKCYLIGAKISYFFL